MNTICREIKREYVHYEPDIITEVKSDGTQASKVVVRVYPDKLNREESTCIPWDIFNDKIYFDVKEVYEECEEKDFKIQDADKANDEETFGWNLADAWHQVGNVYIFLLSIFNLCNFDEEYCPIYDSKGEKVGDLLFAADIKIFDSDQKTEL